MWSERFVIIVQSLQRDFLPSTWATYTPTWVDLGILFGTIGFFSFLFLLFLRFVPFISLSEMKEMKHELVREERAWLTACSPSTPTEDALARGDPPAARGGLSPARRVPAVPVARGRRGARRAPLAAAVRDLRGSGSWARAARTSCSGSWSLSSTRSIVGGRPPHFPLAFVIITFEMGVLFAGLSAFFGTLVLGRLVRLLDEVQGTPGFDSATRDRFWLEVSARDPAYDAGGTRRLLSETGALRIEAPEVLR